MNKIKCSQWLTALSLALGLISFLANDYLIAGYSLSLMTFSICALVMAVLFQLNVDEERIKELAA